MENIDRNSGYFEITHTGVAAFVPASARRLLSLGCGTGATEAFLKEQFALETVVGVEVEPDIAASAEAVLDAVHVGDVEALELPYPPGHFDMILCLDVLEHLRDPWRVVQDRLYPLLAPGGVLVVSLPNVRYWMVFWRLFWGRWGYARRGILDKGHLRFFTPSTAREMLAGAGFSAITLHRKYRLYDSLGDKPSGRLVGAVTRRIMPVLTRLRFFDVFFPLRDFFTFQIVLVAHKSQDGR
ncbi:MAG: class I SAM-dependent methyltransferase [Anaerolineae bacterium]